MQRSISKAFLCFALMLFSFLAPGQQTKNNLKSVEWIIGTWQRTNTKPGQTAYEKWEKTSKGEFRGMGVTLEGKDTVFVEKLKIMAKDNELFYVADVAHNKAPVYFKFTKLGATGFVSSNPAHDFPKEISYQLAGEKLQAKISGDGKAIGFDFVKTMD